MSLLDINGLWAIRPEARDEILYSLDRFLESASPEQIAAFFARRPQQESGPEPLGYDIQGDGVAVLRVDGPLSKRAMTDWWTGRQIGITYGQIVGGLKAAQADTNVRAVLVAWDSPGGTVDGMQEAANEVYAMRGGKPMESVACGQMCSAAEGVGSAVGPVWASSDTTDLGSIGVLAIHRDYSAMEEKWGIKTTLLTAGKYKGVGFGPLSRDDKAILQEGLDHSYDVFKTTVARNRGVSMDAVEAMAEGRVFRGQKAVQIGLAQGIATISNRVAALSKRAVSVPTRGLLAAADPNQNNQQEKTRMTKEELLAQHPDLAAAFRDEGRAEGIQAGAEAERKRIESVMGLSRPGHEALVRTMAFDGKTTAGEAAMAILQAQDKARTQRAEDLASDTPDPVSTPKKPDEGATSEKPSVSATQLAAKIHATIQEHAAKGVTITPQQALQIIRKEG